jgi:hypothetical protein
MEEDAAPARCVQSEGRFAGSSWDALADAIVQNDLAGGLDREFAALADAFRLQGAPD